MIAISFMMASARVVPRSFHLVGGGDTFLYKRFDLLTISLNNFHDRMNLIQAIWTKSFITTRKSKIYWYKNYGTIRVIQILCTKFANFTRLYLPLFITFHLCNFTNFKIYALFRWCGERFSSYYLDQNWSIMRIVYSDDKYPYDLQLPTRLVFFNINKTKFS